MGIIKEIRKYIKILEEQRKTDEELKHGINKSTDKMEARINKKGRKIEISYDNGNKIIGKVGEKGIAIYHLDKDDLMFCRDVDNDYYDYRKTVNLPDKAAKQLGDWLYQLFSEGGD